MTEEKTDSRLRPARWAIVGAFGLIAVLVGTVAFAGGVLPGQTATYADLPVIRIASRSMASTASIPATRPAPAGRTTTIPPPPTGKKARAASSAGGKATASVAPAKTPSGSATDSSKGNTSHKKSTDEEKREVVDPDVRVDDSDRHKSDGDTKH